MEDLTTHKIKIEEVDLSSVFTNLSKDELLELDLRENNNYESIEWDNKNIIVYDVYSKQYKYHCGYALIIDGSLSSVISIYEPHGYGFIINKELFIVRGYDDMILFELDTNEIHEICIN